MNLQRLQRMSLPFFGYCKGGGDSSQESSYTDSSGSTTYDPTQSGNYKELTGGASDLFKQGQGAGNQEGVDFLNSNLQGAAGGYMDALNGTQDRTALDAAKGANMDSAGISSQRAMNNIGIASQGTGTAASGRRGIAEGVASADIFNQANSTNANMEADFQQQGLNRQLQAAQGLSGMTGDIIGGMQEGDRQSDYNRQLENLLGYRDLISGDMGGTTEGSEVSDTIVDRRDGGGNGSLIGQAGPGATPSSGSGPSSNNTRDYRESKRDKGI
jgi:hypothetical protein